MFKHWKTTMIGILLIIAALAHAATQYLQGQPVSYPILWTGLTTGWGFIHAADASKVK